MGQRPQDASMYIVRPQVLLQLSCCPKVETVRWEGYKDGCFWTTVPSGTCAKAVCSHLSQHQHGVGCQGQPCGCDCPSQLRKFLFSNFQTLKTTENFANVHLLGQLSTVRNSGGWRQGSVRTPEKCEGWSRYQNSMGADSPKTSLETEYHVPKAEHIDPIKSCFIRDDLQMTVHLYSKGHLPTPAL